MGSLLTALEGVQAVSRDKDFYNLHLELGALFFLSWFIFPVNWGV